MSFSRGFSFREFYSTDHRVQEKLFLLELLPIIPNVHLFVYRVLNSSRNSLVKVHEWFENFSSWLGEFKSNSKTFIASIFLFVISEHAPSIIFMDEIDSIGSTRVEGSSGGDSEVQRTMLELLNQLDGFEPKQNIK